MKKTLDVESLLRPDGLAVEIGNKWAEWDMLRQQWKDERKVLRNYLYATDTSTTQNKTLPWSNSTTTPKLTQIYDNLKANYSAALFPNDNWMEWEAGSRDDNTQQKADVIKSFMRNKWRASGSELAIDTILDDFIQGGNAFGTVEYVREYTDLENGERVPGYIGPRVVRISPYDIVFNPTAARFEDTPKIVRSIISLGEAKLLIENGDEAYNEVFDKISRNRREVIGSTSVDKSDGYVADGFSNIEHYYGSGYVEVLTFYGDIYDLHTETLKTNRIIKVVDRAYIISDDPVPSWLGTSPIFHAGWRSRPDNLIAMGPLDNLVGLQYRIDHLENLKADVFDQIAFPVLKVRGDVEAFNYAPGSRIYMGEDGDVAHLVPDATALNADLQIQLLENKMEEMAGAPRQAMGIRTPGEKTAFEVQTLQNSASRIFEHKAIKFEREFLEKCLMAMLESSRRNMDHTDHIRVFDSSINAEYFRDIKKEDITSSGKIIPKGARHFAEKALRLQNLNSVLQIKLADPTISVHMSGKEIARILTEEIGEPQVYEPNVQIEESLETQKASADAEIDYQDDLAVKQEMGI